jgi:hypothetical protein
MVSEGNAPGLGGGQSSPKRCARTQTSGPVERIPLAPTVGSDLRERRSAQRLPHSADKDEAKGSSPPRPTAGPDQRKRWLTPARARRCAHHGPHVQGFRAERFSHMDVCPESGRLGCGLRQRPWGDPPGFAATACRLQLAGYAPAAGVVTDAVARVRAQGGSRCRSRAVAWCE